MILARFARTLAESKGWTKPDPEAKSVEIIGKRGAVIRQLWPGAPFCR
jgi:hypothetical protein